MISIIFCNICLKYMISHNICIQPTGSITVVDDLDFEQKKEYELMVRATDTNTGSYAESIVQVHLTVCICSGAHLEKPIVSTLDIHLLFAHNAHVQVI